MIALVPENDPALKQVAPEYDFDNTPEKLKELGLRSFIDSMFVCMQINDGMGLAASQLGFNLRIFVMKIAGEEYTCINPIIKEQSEESMQSQEGCLSFPQLSLTVKRSNEVFVSYQNIDGVAVQRWLSTVASRCFQHELDHLDGITFDTRVAKLSLKIAKNKRLKTMKQQKRKK